MSTTKSVPTAALHFPVLKDKGGRVWADNRHVTRLLGWKALLFTRPSEFAGVLRRRNPGMSDTEVRRSLWAVLEWRTLRMPADRLLNTSLLSGVPLVVVLASSQVAEFLIPPHDPIALHGATLALFVVTLILAVAGIFTVPVTCAFKLWATLYLKLNN